MLSACTSKFFRLSGDELGPRNNHKDLHIVFNHTAIDQKSEIMLLGIILDDQLSFLSKQCL